MDDEPRIQISQDARYAGYVTNIGYVAGDVHGYDQNPLDRYIERLRLRLEEQEDFYVSLPLESRIRSAYEILSEIESQDSQPGTEAIDEIETALDRYPKFVLIGDPGSGKSTTLRHVAMNLVRAYQNERKAKRLARIPFVIELGNSENPPDAEALVEHWWSKLEAIPESLTPYRKDGLLWLLLDGLNEMPDSLTGPDNRERRAKSLKAFITGYKGPVIITCRTADYDKTIDLGLPKLKVKPLDPNQVGAFAAVYLDGRVEAFMKALDAERGRKVLASNPLNLRFMIEVFQDGLDLPRTREKLFDLLVLLRYCRERQLDFRKFEDQAVARREVEQLEPAWQRLAFAMFMDGATTVDERWAARQLVHRPWRWLPRAGRRGLRQLVGLGLLVSKDDGQKLEFYHQSLLDHFALPMVGDELAPRREMRWLIRRLEWLEGRKLCLHRQARQILERLDDTRRRAALVERISRLETQAMSAMPVVVKLYVGEAHKVDARLYRAALVAAVTIVAECPDEAAGRLFRTLLADAALAEVSVLSKYGLSALARAHALDRALDRATASAVGDATARMLGLIPLFGVDHSDYFDYGFDRAAARTLGLKPDYGASALASALAWATARARALARVAELGLEPFDPEKIEGRRRELLAELPGLAGEVVRAYEAGELN